MSRTEVRLEVKKNDFKKIANEYPGKVSRVVRKTAFDIIRAAAPLTRKKTGKLRASPQVVMTSKTSATITWMEHYAIYQNFGTRFMSGTHFANQSVTLMTNPFLEALKDIQGG